MSLDAKLLKAVCEILGKGEKVITGHKIAEHLGVNSGIVYRRFKQIRKG